MCDPQGHSPAGPYRRAGRGLIILLASYGIHLTLAAGQTRSPAGARPTRGHTSAPARLAVDPLAELRAAARLKRLEFRQPNSDDACDRLIPPGHAVHNAGSGTNHSLSPEGTM